MANKKLGFIPLYRSIQEHWLWQKEEPFDIRSAWIDLLLSVNHEEKKILVGRSVVTIRAGQMWTSYKKLSKKWHWSYKRVLRYINLLKSDGMIAVDGTSNGTLLTVINYGNFAYQGQARDTSNDTPDDTPSDTPNDTSGDIQTININNINNENKLKKEPVAEPPLDGGEWQ